MAAYLISGVWKTRNGVITDVLLHPINSHIGNSYQFGPGYKRTEAQVIALLDTGNNVYVNTWDYSRAGWDIGVSVSVFKRGERRYIRSHRDGTVTDNLDNLIDFTNIIAGF